MWGQEKLGSSSFSSSSGESSTQRFFKKNFFNESCSPSSQVKIVPNSHGNLPLFFFF